MTDTHTKVDLERVPNTPETAILLGNTGPDFKAKPVIAEATQHYASGLIPGVPTYVTGDEIKVLEAAGLLKILDDGGQLEAAKVAAPPPPPAPATPEH